MLRIGYCGGTVEVSVKWRRIKRAHLPGMVLDSRDGRGQPDIQALAERDRHAAVAVAHGHVRARELELVVLVPVLQAEEREGRRVRELQVGQVPVEHLPVRQAQVHVDGRAVLERVQPLLHLGDLSV